VCLSSLAECPPLIARLFEFDEKNPYGFYPIWLFINGAWQRYIIDDYLPVVKGTNHLAFSRTHENEMWVILLEKAYAKAYGGYWNIKGGDPVHALRDLTGAPYRRIIDFSNPLHVWDKLNRANEQGFMMTCLTENTSITEEKQKTGIASGHAYSILDVRKYTDSQGRRRKLIQIRNPWGRFEWNGAFSDKSPLWKDSDKHQYIHVEEDGLFWMCVEDFVVHYKQVGLLAIKPDYRSNAIYLEQSKSNNTSIARLIVDESTCDSRGQNEVFISLDQTDSRSVDNESYKYRYSFACQ
jgi:calpain-15